MKNKPEAMNEALEKSAAVIASFAECIGGLTVQHFADAREMLKELRAMGYNKGGNNVEKN